MYINEVIREADALNPNEYALNEKYAWIDELNATLMQEHMQKYASVELEPMEDGTYLLPEGITFEMVDKIIAHGRSIEKYDFRSFGFEPIYTPRERFYIPLHCMPGGAITVIYLAQYEPIRTAVAEDVTISIYERAMDVMTLNPPKDGLLLTDVGSFQKGDTVNVVYEGGSYENVIVDSVEPQGGGTYEVRLLLGLYDRMLGDTFTATVKKIIMDETLLPAPYDRLYIDWIIAKIAFYQKNYTVYNQNMNKFYNTLRQFDNWYIQRAPRDKDNKIRNWMK